MKKLRNQLSLLRGHHTEMIKESPLILMAMFISVSVGLFFTLKLIPEDLEVNPFPFYDLPSKGYSITLQHYIYYLSEYASKSMLFYLIYRLSSKYRCELLIFFLLSLLEIVDYCLVYNMPWLYITGFKINYDLFRTVVYVAVILRAINNNHEKY